jgi:PPP family 3-phenylpropionic acid transporter
VVHRIPHRRLAGFYFFYFAYLGTFAPFFSLYLESVELTPFEIGVLMALPQVTRIVASHLWGWLADRGGRRMRVVRWTGIAGTLAFLFVFAGTHFALLFATLFAMTFFWSAALPLMEATTLSHLGEDTSRYGPVRVWGSVGFIVAVVGGGYLLDIFPLSAVPVLVLVMMLAILAFACAVPESPALAHEPGHSIGRVLLRPEVVALIASGAFMSAAHGPYYTFYSIHLVGEGYSKAATGWLWALGVACEIGIFAWMPRLYQAFTLRRILLVSYALAALRFLLIAWLAQSFAVLLFAQVLHAASFGAFHAASIGYVHRIFRGRLQARGQAIYGSFSFGIGGALGALVSGYVWEHSGAALTFSVGAGCAALGGVLFALGSRAEARSLVAR